MKHQTIHLHESAFLAPGAVAVGDVEIGENASVWYNATLRGDSPLRIGAARIFRTMPSCTRSPATKSMWERTSVSDTERSCTAAGSAATR